MQKHAYLTMHLDSGTDLTRSWPSIRGTINQQAHEHGWAAFLALLYPLVRVMAQPLPPLQHQTNWLSSCLALLLALRQPTATLTSIPARPFIQLVTKAVAAGDDIVTADAARIGQYTAGEPVAPSAAELAGRLFTTVYMGTENSSADTRNR
jgi:hypothetical protein